MTGTPPSHGPGCVVQELSARVASDPCLRAVWLDTVHRRISYACQPGRDGARVRAELDALVRHLSPDASPRCATEPWRIRCEVCERWTHASVPPGVRLLHLPDAGLLLEKESCSTAARMWRWHQLPWFHVEPLALPPEKQPHDWKLPLVLAGATGALTLAGFIVEHRAGGGLDAVSITLYVLAYLCGAYDAATEAFELLRKRTLDVHFLMLCVAIGAAAIGHWWEGAALLFLFSLSGALEDFAMKRTEREIKSLFRSAPKTANVLDAAGHETAVAVEALQPGMKLLIRPGEQIPVDAELVAGESATDESALTGESVPVEKSPGDKLLAGTMNLWGQMTCVALKPASESALAKIIRLIREAQESKAPSQRFTDHFGTAYTYAILGLCTAMFLVWWLAFPMAPRDAFYRTMTLLVVASPCALVLSIPSAILAGIAAGARRGILFRGGSAIERLAEVRRVGLDKTGTLTTGNLRLQAVETLPPGREQEALAAAAALGRLSTHPVAQGLLHAARAAGLPVAAAAEFRSLAGSGLTGVVAGCAARLGRRSMFADDPWLAARPLPVAGQTEVLFSWGDLRARFTLEDEIRTASRPLLEKLAAWGLRPTMLTGDRMEAAHSVAKRLGLRDVEAGLSPEQKVERVRAWAAHGERPAMVGDGVNDAPSLAAAHVAVAMGMRGSDAALEQADVVLMKDRLDRFTVAYELSRRARAIIRQNLAISLGSVLVLVASAFFGAIPLTLGVIGHEGSTVVVVLNSLRLLFIRFAEDHAPREG